MKIVKHQPSSLINSATSMPAVGRPDQSILKVDLSSGKTYSYVVPNSVVAGLEAAPSAGRYFNETIRLYEALES